MVDVECHRMYEAVRSGASVRDHFSRLPSTPLCGLLSLVELWRLRSSCAGMLNVLPIVDILKQFISQRGVFVPHSFLDVEDLQFLCHLAQTAPGATWTLKSETNVREAIQTFKLAMQTWHVNTNNKVWATSWGEMRRLAFSLDLVRKILSEKSYQMECSGNTCIKQKWFLRSYIHTYFVKT